MKSSNLQVKCLTTYHAQEFPKRSLALDQKKIRILYKNPSQELSQKSTRTPKEFLKTKFFLEKQDLYQKGLCMYEIGNLKDLKGHK